MTEDINKEESLDKEEVINENEDNSTNEGKTKVKIEVTTDENEENSAKDIEENIDSDESKENADGIFTKIKNKFKGEAKEETLSELDKLKLDKEEIDDKYVRLYAEFDNFRRRTAKEKLDTIKTAGRDIIADLLSVLDDFDRAKKAISEAKEKNTEPDYSGYDLIYNKLTNLLTTKGLKEMETKEQLFNADLHEAITEIPAPDPALKGKIIDTIEKGYTLNDVIIRHPKVVVGK